MAVCAAYRWILVAFFITCVASFRDLGVQTCSMDGSIDKQQSLLREKHQQPVRAWWLDCCKEMTPLKSGAQGTVYDCACNGGKGGMVVKEEKVMAPKKGPTRLLAQLTFSLNTTAQDKADQIEGQMALSQESSYIVGVPAHKLVGNTHTILMEKLSGDLESLREPLKMLNDELDDVRMQIIAAVAVSLMRGLYVMHNRGFVHSDIKPGNLMLGGIIDLLTEPLKCQVKITDFGTTYSYSQPEKNKAFGDPRVLAPEVIEAMLSYLDGNGTYIPAPSDDLFSAGVVLLQLWLQGQPTERIPKDLRTIQEKELWWLDPGTAFELVKTGKSEAPFLDATAQKWVKKELFQYRFLDEEGYLPEPLYRLLFASETDSVAEYEVDPGLLNQAYTYGVDPQFQNAVGPRILKGLMSPLATRLSSKEALDLCEDLYRSMAGDVKAPDFTEIFPPPDRTCLTCLEGALMSISD